MDKSDKENKIINGRYKIINRYKTDNKLEKFYLAKDLNDSTEKLIKKITLKEDGISKELLDKIFYNHSMLLKEKNDDSPEMLDYFIDEDLCIIFEYEDKKSLKNFKTFPSIGYIMLDKYFIIEGLSVEDYGKIYLAGDLKNENNFFIIKELESKEVEEGTLKKNFKKDARLLSQINHKNIPAINDFFIKKDRYYMVREYIQGETIHSYISGMKDDEYIKEELIINWGEQLFEAIEYLHNLEKPVMVRNLNPDNIIISQDALLKIIDFGLNRLFEKEKSYKYLDRGFAAPEQWEGLETNQSDIYSLGATLYYIITRHYPGELISHIQPPSSYNSNISEKLDQIILKSLKEKTDERYSSINDFKKEFLKLKKTSKHWGGTTGVDKEKEILLKAKSMRNEGAVEEAIILYKNLLKLNPKNAMAYYSLGVCYDEMGYLDEALENFITYKDKVEEPDKQKKVEKKIKRLLGEIKEDDKRLEELRREREEKYKQFLEVKWINGIVEIPTLDQVKKRLKIESDSAEKIEREVKLTIETTLTKEREEEKKILETIEAKRIQPKYKSWDKTTEEPEEKKKSDEEAIKNYYMAVELAWKDGTIDEHEYAYLEKMRNITGITEEEARAIETEVKEKFKEKIKAAKEEWLREEKERQSINSDAITIVLPDLEISSGEADRGQKKETLDLDPTRKDEVRNRYKNEVKNLWLTSRLNGDVYKELLEKRGLLGISDREGLEIEREVEKERKALLDQEELKKLESINQLTDEEKEQKIKELIPVKLEGLSKKGFSEAKNSSVVSRDFPESGLKQVRGFIVMATGTGKYQSGMDDVATYATKTFSKAITEHKDKFNLDPERCKALLIGILMESVYQVFKRAENERLPSIKLNIMAIVIIHNHYLIGNLGNISAYIVEKEKIIQLTKEHLSKAIGIQQIQAFLRNTRKIKPAIFPLDREFFDLIPGKIIFLCDRQFIDIIGLDEIRRQLNEMDSLSESIEGLANLAYFIKEGIQDILISAVEVDKMERKSSSQIIQFDVKNISNQRKSRESLLGKIKKLFS